MKLLKELVDAIESHKVLVWKDPDPNPEMRPKDYIISRIEPLGSHDEFEEDSEIFIEYMEGYSEAIVTLNEIEIFEDENIR